VRYYKSIQLAKVSDQVASEEQNELTAIATKDMITGYLQCNLNPNITMLTEFINQQQLNPNFGDLLRSCLEQIASKIW
jgi:hypothetical protein